MDLVLSIIAEYVSPVSVVYLNEALEDWGYKPKTQTSLSYEMIKELEDEGKLLDLIELAAQTNDLEALEFARECWEAGKIKIPHWNESICSEAMCLGHLKVVQWVLEHNYPHDFSSWTQDMVCVSSRFPDVLEWILFNELEDEDFDDFYQWLVAHL